MSDCDWIEFIETRPRNRKTKVVQVRSNPHAVLAGLIKWHPHWRQYAFFPEEGSIWTPECMEAVASQIDALMAERAAA
jgi:hypothetical protein